MGDTLLQVWASKLDGLETSRTPVARMSAHSMQRHTRAAGWQRTATASPSRNAILVSRKVLESERTGLVGRAFCDDQKPVTSFTSGGAGWYPPGVFGSEADRCVVSLDRKPYTGRCSLPTWPGCCWPGTLRLRRAALLTRQQGLAVRLAASKQHLRQNAPRTACPLRNLPPGRRAVSRSGRPGRAVGRPGPLWCTITRQVLAHGTPTRAGPRRWRRAWGMPSNTARF